MIKIPTIRTTLWVIGLLFFGGSLVANAILFSAAKKYYLEVQTARFNPLSLDAYRDDVPEKGNLPRVVFYGDSRAFQWPFPTSDQFEYFNRGIGAQTSNQVLLRYEEHVTPLDPDILLVQMCINELKTVPIFPTKRKQILASCRQNTLKVIEYAEASGTTVILTTVFPVGEISLRRRFLWSPDVAAAVNEINQFVRDQASENVIIFDSFDLLVDENGQTDPEYAFDLLHLNSAGYEHLNENLIDILNDLVDN